MRTVIEETREIYDLTHRQITLTPSGQAMMAYLWRDWGGYVGQLSWTTRDQLRELTRATALAPRTSGLDLCCGTGGIARYLAEATGCAMTGIDYSQPAIDIARRAATAVDPPIRFDHGDARELPYATATFDAVVSVDSLVIVPDRHRVVAECARVLKPGGRLVFTDEVLTGPFPRDADTLRALAVYGRLFPQTPSGYRRLLTHAGFVDIDIRDSTAMFVAINRRWAESYRLFETQGREILGDKLFDDGLAFFETLGEQGAAGRLGQIRVLATRGSA